mmetsp:Transcript_32843/g.96850  ORF Transcript_32843/g.96850 Transcript_32843/m.96850 type:complete len:495 (+) Transcript_32843:380-1864(+)
MQLSTSGETSVLEVAASSPDPEAADTKMASEDEASHMSVSSDSSESQESKKAADEKPSDGIEASSTIKAEEATSVSAGAAAAAAASTSTSDDEASRLIDQLGPSGDDEDKAKESSSITSVDASKSLPSFPVLPSGENESLVTDDKSRSDQAMSPPNSSTTEAAVVTDQKAINRVSEAAHSPSIAIAKRPKPGGASSKLRASQMQNNPVRGDGSATASITPLRRGKWTVEEEEYAALVIQMFNAGYLPAPAGTTLRAYLSDKLHCDPMRITKKFTGSSCIGKRVFHPAVRCAENAAAIDSAQEELVSLEKRWRRRLKLKRGSSRKHSTKRETKAVRAAASTSAATSTPGHHSASTNSGVVLPPAVSPPSEQWSADSSSATYPSQPASGATSNESSPPVPSAAAQLCGASWMDRAQALLGGESTTNNGPSSENSYARRKVSDTSHTGHEGKERQTPPSTISATVSPSEAKDAEALVGFLNSVRAEAASGNTGGGGL